MPTFTFTTSITKGRHDTEYDVEVTYSADRKGQVEIIDAKCPVHLTDERYSSVAAQSEGAGAGQLDAQAAAIILRQYLSEAAATPARSPSPSDTSAP